MKNSFNKDKTVGLEIAKARPHSEEWQTDTFVQKQWSMARMINLSVEQTACSKPLHTASFHEFCHDLLKNSTGESFINVSVLKGKGLHTT